MREDGRYSGEGARPPSSGSSSWGRCARLDILSENLSAAAPLSRGALFADCYLNGDWAEGDLSRETGRYPRIEYKFRAVEDGRLAGRNIESQLGALDTFIDSAFYQNDAWLLCALCTMRLSLP